MHSLDKYFYQDVRQLILSYMDPIYEFSNEDYNVQEIYQVYEYMSYDVLSHQNSLRRYYDKDRNDKKINDILL